MSFLQALLAGVGEGEGKNLNCPRAAQGHTRARDSHICWRIWLIREKAVPLSEKLYHFWKSRTTFRQLWLTHARDNRTCA